MELKIKFMKWSTGMYGAMLNRKTAKKIGLHPKDRINIRTISRKPKEVFTFVNTIDHLVKSNEIIISSETKERFGLKNGQMVEVNLAKVSPSINLIKKKLDGKILSQKEIKEIIANVVDNSLSEAEIALFVSAMYEKGMNFKETISLIKAILETGNTFSLNSKFVADKHSIGGIPGNRTTPIVVPICAVAGLVMPKNSSRAITSATGTADVIEAIARVEFSIKELKKILKKTNAFMVWGGALGVVPADSKIIQIEKSLKIDPEAQLLASIMAKKLAVDSKYIVIDIPYGKNAKVDRKKALHLKKKFESVGRYFNRKLEVVLTDGNKPIGRGIGPIPELRDIISVLDPSKKGPKDLEEKSLMLAGRLLEMSGKVKKGKGIARATYILNSGLAFKKFKEIINAQGGSLSKIKPSKFEKKIIAKKSGRVVEIINRKINNLAKIAGSPIDKAAGLYLHKNVGERVEKGKPIITIYAESKSRLNQAI
ncbi:MAG: thymidine phosphorylase, partial [Nanoarchaeota archaeon]|nr:thymidine phosphorylase [Nanoarchaeota archaeon]